MVNSWHLVDKLILFFTIVTRNEKAFFPFLLTMSLQRVLSKIVLEKLSFPYVKFYDS